MITRMLVWDAIPWSPASVDITDGTSVCWWLWTCNLGAMTEEVIGPGIYAATLARSALEEVHFTFWHVGTGPAGILLGVEQRLSLIHI